MKPNQCNRFFLISAAAGLLAAGNSFAQTVEVNPAGAIPAAYTLVPSGTWNWDTDMNIESWTPNSQLTLDAGTPTGGIVSGTVAAASADPNFTSPIVTIPTPYRVIVEFRVKKEASDTSRIDLFWDDAVGGFAGARTVTVQPATFAADGNFKVVRITFPAGKIATQLDQLRFDPIADLPNAGKTMQLDYLRVYTETVPALSWDPDTVTPGAQGGSGIWNQAGTANWWDGGMDVVWPASGKSATFAGTAGPVTVSGTVNANYAEFQTTGYTLTGGTINIGSDNAVFTNSVNTFNTRIDSPLTGSAPLQFVGGGIFVLGANNPTLGGPVTQVNGSLGIIKDNSVGTGTFTSGALGNTFISALDGDRTLANNVIFAGNRMVIDNNVYGTGLTSGNLTINGTLALNCIAPGDFFLRKTLTANGVVSGSNSNLGIVLAGDPGTLKLSNAGNTFTGNITWSIGATVEADSNGALGALANSLKFNATGTLRMLAAFNSAHPIVVNNFNTGVAGTGTTIAQINTNGFDSTWTGTISAPVFSAPAVAQQITSFAKQGAGILTLNSGGVTANNLRSGGIRVDGGTLKIASGAITTGGSTANGVSGACFMEVNGGSLLTGNFSVGKSVGTGTFTLNTGATYTNNAEFLISFGGDGVANINGGLADLNQFSMVNASPDTSTMNLNGGEVRLNFFNARANGVTPATAVINFNSSIIKAKSTNTDFIETNSTTAVTANVQGGGAVFDSNNFNITIKQPLVHDAVLGATLDGGLTKNGLGTLTLAPVAGPNTYTGPTTVNAGILAVNGSSIADNGKLNITAGKVLVPAATNEVVDTLFLNGVQQTAGVYGSSISGAANQSDIYFDATGSGTLTVNSSSSGASYATFIAGTFANGTVPSGQQGPKDDPDSDGISNLIEYAVAGLDPTVGNGSVGTISGRTLTVSKRQPVAGDITYSIQESATLVGGSWITVTPTVNNSTTISYTLPAGPTKDFMRLVITQP